MAALQAVDLGFPPQNLLAMDIDLPWAKYPDADQFNGFYGPLLERIRALPSVRAVGGRVDDWDPANIFSSPDARGTDFTIAGPAGLGQLRSARWLSVTPGFFDAVGMRWLAGRAFDELDRDAIVIDETLARECFPDSDPLGQTFVTGDEAGQKSHTVVGVVNTIRCFDAPGAVLGTVYTRGTEYSRRAVVLVRTDGDPMRLTPAIREIVAQLENDHVIGMIEPFEATLSEMLAPRRFVMVLLGIFAGIALALATIGVYGLLQYSTTQQTREVGIRMALGGSPADILRAIVGRGLKLSMIGIVLGLAGAVFLTRMISGFLYGVTHTDPLTFACVSLALAGATLLASYIPARRASRIDPMAALRQE
jgi:putative ABC transport system permease protein